MYFFPSLYSHKTYAPMVIAGLFIIAENWEHLKYPSVDE